MRAFFLLLLSLSVGSLFAENLIPVAGMAVDDENITLAERTAKTILSRLGISPAERTQAEEILVRSELAKGEYEQALARVEATPGFTPERRLVLTLAALNGQDRYVQALATYDAARIPANDAWGVAALRLFLQANLGLKKEATALALFEAVHVAPGATPQIRAENALLWISRMPTEKAFDALLEGAAQADKGGVFLDCALVTPTCSQTAAERAKALDVVVQILSRKGLPSSTEASLALTAAELVTEKSAQLTYARQAVAAAHEESIRRRALVALGERLILSPKTAKEGLSLLGDAVRLNPSAPEAPAIQLSIAETLQSLKETDAALLAYNRYLESYDDARFRIRVRRGRGRALLAAKRPEEALVAFEEAAELAKESVEAPTLLAEAAAAAYTAKRYAKAATLYRKVAQTDKTPATLLRLAQSCEAAGEMEEAKKWYGTVRDQATENEAERCVAVLHLGALLSAEGKADDAIQEYSRSLSFVKDTDRQAQLRLERGRAYHALGQLTAAKEDFATAASIPNTRIAAEAKFFLVLSLYGLGEDDHARTLAEEYATLYPESERIPDILLWLAKSDFNRGEYGAAEKGFGSFAERWPKDPRLSQALLLAARSAYQEQEYTRTVEWIGRLAKDLPQTERLADARFLQCEALMELARYGEARDLLDALIRRSPNAPWLGEAYGRKADCLFITATDDPSRYPLALEAYREAITRLEDDPNVCLMYLYKIGRILEKQNLRDEAAEQYTKLVYRVLTQPEIYTDTGLQWLQKSLSQLRSIDTARGNRSGFETLLQRVHRARIPGLALPQK
ncbi:MAG: tetratricopeptide repeat protein [Kiritimatiellia bacterium]